MQTSQLLVPFRKELFSFKRLLTISNSTEAASTFQGERLLCFTDSYVLVPIVPITVRQNKTVIMLKVYI